MIGMPSLPIRKNDHSRTRFANDAGHLQPILPGIFYAAVGKVERPSPADSKNLGGVICFAGAIFCGAPGPHFSLREIEDASAMPPSRGPQQRPAAGLLYVVAVWGNGQDVQRWVQWKGRHVSRGFLAPARRFHARSSGAPPFP